MRILTLTLNPCVDRTLFVSSFGQTPCSTAEMSGGKGVNVARVLAKLGCDCVALAPCGGETGRLFARLARNEGVPLVEVPVAGRTRVVETTVKKDTFEQRVRFEPGPELTDGEIGRVREQALSLLPGCALLAVCGSSSCHKSALLARELIAKARASGVKTLLDSSGETLRLGVLAGPDVVKPNEKELAELTGAPAGEYDQAAAAGQLLSLGVGRVLLSLGERGCVQFTPDQTDFCPAPRVTAVNPVGSGDCFVAGWLHAQLNGRSDRFALAEGCAAGAANAAVFPAAMIGKSDIESLLGYRID